MKDVLKLLVEIPNIKIKTSVKLYYDWQSYYNTNFMCIYKIRRGLYTTNGNKVQTNINILKESNCISSISALLIQCKAVYSFVCLI